MHGPVNVKLVENDFFFVILYYCCTTLSIVAWKTRSHFCEMR